MRCFKAMLVALLCAVGFLAGQGARAAMVDGEIRSYVESILAKGGTSASYAIFQNGRLLLADAVGHIDASKKQPATITTLYNIGSASKVYTAAAVMALVQDGKVNLDDPVVKYLPDFRINDLRYKAITVRMLLDHSSGMLGSDYVNAITFGEYDEGFPEKQTSYFHQSILKANPGKFSVYCNDGFDVAQRLVARVSGLRFEDYLQVRLFEPLGVTSTGYATRAFTPGSYAVMGSMPHEFMNNMGSGGVSTNITDMARFGQMFLDRGASVLAPAVVDEMARGQGRTFIASDTSSPRYGLGWDSVEATFPEVDFGPNVLDKSAGTGQFVAQLYVIPQYQMVAAMAVTQDFAAGVQTTLREITMRVLRAQGIETAKPPVELPPLSPQPLPVNFERDFAGIYAQSDDGSSTLFHVAVNPDGESINLLHYDGEHPAQLIKTLWFDGMNFSDASGVLISKFVEAEGLRFIMQVSATSPTVMPYAQKLEPVRKRYGQWLRRLNTLYLPAEIDFRQGYDVASGLRLIRIKGLSGLLFVRQAGETGVLTVVNDKKTGVFLQLPGNFGRDLNNLWVTQVGQREGLARNNYKLRPVSGLTSLSSGTVKIDRNGANRLYRIPRGSLTISMPPAGGRVIAYDKMGQYAYDSIPRDKTLSTIPASGFIRFAGPPGAQFKVSVTRDHD